MIRVVKLSGGDAYEELLAAGVAYVGAVACDQIQESQLELIVPEFVPYRTALNLIAGETVEPLPNPEPAEPLDTSTLPDFRDLVTTIQVGQRHVKLSLVMADVEPISPPEPSVRESRKGNLHSTT